MFEISIYENQKDQKYWFQQFYQSVHLTSILRNAAGFTKVALGYK